MKHMVNGRLIEVSTDSDGSVDSDQLRKAAGIPNGRPLILQLPDGSSRVINSGERVRVSPEDFFVDAPAHKRGAVPEWDMLFEPICCCQDVPAITIPKAPTASIPKIPMVAVPKTPVHPTPASPGIAASAPPAVGPITNPTITTPERITLPTSNHVPMPLSEPEEATRLEKHLRILSRYFPLWIEDDYRFVIVSRVPLPPGYNVNRTNILIEVPEDYPLTPPGVADYRVYVSAALLFEGQRLKDLHTGTSPDYDTPGFGPWAWWCYEQINWSPKRDNLVRFIEMIRSDLTDPPTH